MRALEYGLFFGAFSTAAIANASPKPYIFQSREEFKAAYTANVQDKQPIQLTVGNYSNDFVTMGLGLAAAYCLVRLVMSLDNKPIIAQPQLPQQQPVAIHNNVNVQAPKVVNRVNVANPQIAKPYSPDINPQVSNYDWMNQLHEVNCLLIFGAQGTGKTTLIEHEVKCRQELGHDVIVLDPHRK